MTLQGYYSEENPWDNGSYRKRAEDVAERKAILAASNKLKLFDRHLFSGVTSRLSLRRSPNDFVVISEDAAKHYKVQTIAADLYIRKLTVTGYALASIEKTLLKKPTSYNNIDCKILVKLKFHAALGKNVKILFTYVFLNYFIGVFVKFINSFFLSSFLTTTVFFYKFSRSPIKSFEKIKQGHLIWQAIANPALLIATLLENASCWCGNIFYTREKNLKTLISFP